MTLWFAKQYKEMRFVQLVAGMFTFVKTVCIRKKVTDVFSKVLANRCCAVTVEPVQLLPITNIINDCHLWRTELLLATFGNFLFFLPVTAQAQQSIFIRMVVFFIFCIFISDSSSPVFANITHVRAVINSWFTSFMFYRSRIISILLYLFIWRYDRTLRNKWQVIPVDTGLIEIEHLQVQPDNFIYLSAAKLIHLQLNEVDMVQINKKGCTTLIPNISSTYVS